MYMSSAAACRARAKVLVCYAVYGLASGLKWHAIASLYIAALGDVLVKKACEVYVASVHDIAHAMHGLTFCIVIFVLVCVCDFVRELSDPWPTKPLPANTEANAENAADRAHGE